MAGENGLNKVLDYGIHKHSTMGNLGNVLKAFTINLIWTIFIIVFLQRVLKMNMIEIRSLISAQMSIYANISAVIGNNPWVLFFMACVLAPIWEEAAFRWSPFKMARAWDRESGNILKTDFLFPIVILSSIVFGLCHGPVIHILIQGVSGLMLSWVMIKSGYKWAVLTHFLWNFMLMIGLPTLINVIK